MKLFMFVTVLDVVIELAYGEWTYQCPNELFGLVRYCNAQRDYGSCITSCWGPEIISDVDKLACPQGDYAAMQYCDRRADRRACYDTCISNPQQDVVCLSSNTVRSVVKYCTRRKDVQSCVKKCIIPGRTDITSPKPIDCPMFAAEVPQYCSQQSNPTACTRECSLPKQVVSFEDRINCPAKNDSFTVMRYCMDQTNPSDCLSKCPTTGQPVESTTRVELPLLPLVIAARFGSSRRKITGPWSQKPINCPTDKKFPTVQTYCNDQARQPSCYMECWAADRTVEPKEQLDRPLMQQSMMEYCRKQSDSDNCLAECIKKRAPANLGEIVCPESTDNFSVLAHCSWWGRFESYCINECLPNKSHALMTQGKFDCPPLYNPLEVFVYCMRHTIDLHVPCLNACPFPLIGKTQPN